MAMRKHHYRNYTASIKKYEPVIGAYNSASLFLPTGENLELLQEHIDKITGLEGVNPGVNKVTQKAGLHDRTYAGVPEQTSLDITIELTLNLNNAHENYIYNTIRHWFDMSYNRDTGEFGLKVDYAAEGHIEQCDRDGTPWRVVDLIDIVPLKLTGLPDADFSSTEPARLVLTLSANLADELKFGY